jgi:hypothetical protein
MQIYIFHFYNIILFYLYLVGTTTSGSITLDGGAATTGGFKYAFEASTTLDGGEAPLLVLLH